MRLKSTLILLALLAATPLARAGGNPLLCATGDALIVTHLVGEPLTMSYDLSNCGDPGDVNWTSAVLGAITPLVTLDVAAGTISDANPVTVNAQFDFAAVPAGQYNGAIRFFQDGTPIIAKVIQINLQKIEFEVGDTVTGDLTGKGEREAGAVNVIEGLQVKFKFIPDDPSLRARITLLTDQGVPVKSWKTKKSKGGNPKATKKKVTFPGSGIFAMFVDVIAGSGGYTIETDRGKLPKTAKSRLNTKVSAPTGSDTAEVCVGAFANAIMNANVEAGSGVDINALTVDLIDPSGATVNTGAFEQTTENAFHLLQVPLADTGLYKIRVSGLTTGDKVDIPVTPYQPDQASGNVSLDD